MQSDDDLMRTVAEGDLSAFDELVRRHQQSAWRMACRFTGNPADAEDLAQDAFLRVLNAARRYLPAGNFKAYLFKILGRLCLDWARKKKPLYFAEIPERADPVPSQCQEVEAAETGTHVRSALQDLPKNQRVAIILRYYEDMSYADIAKTMGVSEKSVERLLSRGRECLRKCLGQPPGTRG